MRAIAKIRNGFQTKFGIPRQSGLVEELKSTIIFEPAFRSPEAVRELEMFSHIWLIWEFSAHTDKRTQQAGTNREKPNWSPTVRPPRLGGNRRVGVFASRSPFRPNPIGLSCVKLERITFTEAQGPVLHIAGADLMNGTPILDIKPYLPFSDCHPEATGGYAAAVKDRSLEVSVPEPWRSCIPEEDRATLTAILRQDPRPSYQEDPDRVYGFFYQQYEVKFQVKGTQLTVCEIRMSEPASADQSKTETGDQEKTEARNTAG